MIGRVKEVFIPNDIYSNQIGFKITLNDKILEVIEEQDEYNAKILRDDLVTITKQTISGQEFNSIELYEGVEYE